MRVAAWGIAVASLVGTGREVAVNWPVDGSWFLGRCRSVICTLAFFASSCSDTAAHEGHAPLPSKGAVVDLDRGLIQLSRKSREALDIATTPIQQSSSIDSLLASATVVSAPTGRAFAVSRLPGRVATLRVRPGDQVDAGDLLGEVLSQEVERLHLEVQKSVNELEVAERLYRSVKEAGGAVAERDVLAAEVEVQQARNALDLGKTKWLALGLPTETLSLILGGIPAKTPLLPVTAPITGTLSHAERSIGGVIEPGQPLFELIDLSTVWIRLGVLEKDLMRVGEGQRVEVQLAAFPREKIPGEIAIVGKSLAETDLLNEVWVVHPNPADPLHRLLPGMTGSARIAVPRANGTLAIPASALVDHGTDRFVLVEESQAKEASEYRRKSVEVVAESSEVVEVQSKELYPGDLVVSRGAQQLGVFFLPGSAKISPESARTMGLKLGVVKPQSIDSVVSLRATVDLPSSQRGTAAARLPGVLVELDVRVGQAVQAGDVLAQVFSMEFLDLQLDLLKEQLANDLAARELARLREATQAIPRRRLIETEARVAATASRRESVRRELELAGLEASRIESLLQTRSIQPTLPIVAPISGTVVSLDRVIGQALQADEKLCELHQGGRPWLESYAPESLVPTLAPGQLARIRFPGLKEMVLTGRVARQSGVIDPEQRGMDFWIELDEDPPILLRYRQVAQVALTLESNVPSLAVPNSAIVREGNRSFVFVKHAATYDRREVQLGRVDDRHAEVIAGLREGELIANTAAEELNAAWMSVR
jgi:cobalt-zinc-cadmium efflux system membrane fusion protein